MSKTIYWSAYESWLKCPQLWSYIYNDHAPKEPPTPRMELGIRIGQALANRLRNPDWKPTLAFNRNLGSLEGLTGVLREYDARYRSDRLLGPWSAEKAFTRRLDDMELGCVADGYCEDLIRETKVTDTPNLWLYRAQLLWNCICAGVQQGELDLILVAGYHRPDWAFQRIVYAFTEQDKLGLISDLEKFLVSTQGNHLWRNPNQCTWCPHTSKCWGV